MISIDTQASGRNTSGHELYLDPLGLAHSNLTKAEAMEIRNRRLERYVGFLLGERVHPCQNCGERWSSDEGRRG